MRKSKSFICACLTLSLIALPLNFSVNAATPEDTCVIINDCGQDVPQEMIDDIISENPDCGTIHILGYGNIYENLVNDSDIPCYPSRNNLDITSYSSMNNRYLLNPIGFYSVLTNVQTTKNILHYDRFAKDEFKFSVARGEEVTLSTTYTGSLKGSYSGDVLDSSKLGVDITLTGTYQKGTKYTGPSEDSSYNCREYRMKFYENTGTYVQTGVIENHYYGTVISRENTSKTGTFSTPTKYLSYSVDVYIR